MHKPLTALMIASLLLASCGGWKDSRVNPRNWFGNSREVPADVPAQTNPLIPPTSVLKRKDREVPGVPIEVISDLKIEITASGAIILATGIASRQGAHRAELKPVNEDEEPVDGVLEYVFRVLYPEQPTAAGSERSRRIHAAHTVGRQNLEGVRVIRVTGAQNARESRRR